MARGGLSLLPVRRVQKGAVPHRYIIEHIAQQSDGMRWVDLVNLTMTMAWERGPRAGPAGWHSAALDGRTPFVRQTPSRPLLLLLCTDLIYSALLCPILHFPPLPLLCRSCTTTTFFYCRLCLVSGLSCSLFSQLPLSHSVAIQLYHIDKKLTVF